MYRVVWIKPTGFILNMSKELEKRLNKIASEGWELVTMTGAFSVWKKK